MTVTGFAQVTVGDQVPYGGTPIGLPGSFEAGAYDGFQGGLGQDIAYHDASVGNAGDYRPDEYVDAFSNPSEGATIEYIADGEWLEYTVEVASNGVYSLGLRYACDNGAGGGPLYLGANERWFGDRQREELLFRTRAAFNVYPDWSQCFPKYTLTTPKGQGNIPLVSSLRMGGARQAAG